MTDFVFWGFAVLPNVIMNLIKNGRLRKDNPHATEVWSKTRRTRYLYDLSGDSCSCSKAYSGRKSTSKTVLTTYLGEEIDKITIC